MLSTKNYAVRFAFLFSATTALLFGALLYEYGSLVRQTKEAESEAELLTQARRIVLEMDRFNSQTERYFYFPKYKLYHAGLFSKDGLQIFSTLDFTPTLSEGYNIQGDTRYFVYELPSGRYFGADYLVVSKKFFESEIYFRLVLLLLIAISILFGIYLYLIKLFEKPLLKINQNLDRFIKDSIHEINTPLAIITTNIELFYLKHGENKHLGRIKAAAKSLSNLYNDMEYLVKQESVGFAREQLSLSICVHQRVDYFSEIAQMRGIELEREIEDGIECEINRVKLYRLIDNNLSNAIKYSNENSKICIKLCMSAQNRALLSFIDFGIGIEKPEKIFDRYYREELSKGGFGLGLNIVKNICDDEGIGVEVISAVNKGSEFRYALKAQKTSSDDTGAI